MDSSVEPLSEGSRMHEPVASSSSDESLGEVNDEKALHERLLS